MYLLTDIRSATRGSSLYGRKGDEVTLISKNAHVLIVENSEGNRFAVTEDEITDDKVDKDLIVESKPAKQKATTVKQQNLF